MAIFVTLTTGSAPHILAISTKIKQTQVMRQKQIRNFVSTFAIVGLLFSMLAPPQSAHAATYELGDTGPAGGLIFHIDGDTYYEAAPAVWDGGNDTSMEWGCRGKTVPGADGTAIGTGEQNTTDIVAFHDNPANFLGNDYYTYGGDYTDIGCAFGDGTVAAKTTQDLSLNSYDDWFLPSKDELNAMYTNLHQTSLGGFIESSYWSSSENSSVDVLAQGFIDGSQYNDFYKSTGQYFRPARAFTASELTPSDSASTTISATLSSTISLSTSGSVNLSVTPTSSGAASSASDTVSVSTNNSGGYNLSLSNGDTTTDLVNGADTIAAHAGTFAAPTTLVVNSWGYRSDGVGSFGAGPSSAETNQTTLSGSWAGVPSSASPQQLKSTSSVASDDETTVWYGVGVDMTNPNGTYTDTVTYTAVTN